MGKVCWLFTAVTVLAVAFVAQHLYAMSRPRPAPAVRLNEHWGRGPASATPNTAIVAQQISYPPATIAELRSRLNASLLPLHEPLEGMLHDHEYGLNPRVLRNLVSVWRDEYLPKWEERQAFLNTVPHFKTEIQGLSIHFIHLKPTAAQAAGKTVLPLLLLHGWPGSVREFYDFFPLLTQPNAQSPYVFEVIAPSLPGFGWSEGATRVNFGTVEVAIVVRNLMLRVGHQRFVVQGGDWGSIIGSNVATLFPENVIAYHSNYCQLRTGWSTVKLLVASLYPKAFVPSAEHVEWVFPLGAHFKKLIAESGYFHLQATKPDTIGIALTGNPVGMAAYFYEKFVSAYPSHDVTAVLDNIMIYYLTNSAHTSGRLYAEAMTQHQGAYDIFRVPVTVPVACARFRRDMPVNLDWQLRDKYVNLVQSTWHPQGGHFAAMEVPQALYKDFVEFLAKIDVA